MTGVTKEVAARREAGAPAAQAPWTPTASGQVWDLLDPDSSKVVWADIGYQLGQIPRFGGAARPMVSVAQHSMLVAVLVPERLRLHALLHDAHEAILGDWTTPVKQALAVLGDMRGFHELERRTALAIHRAAGIEFPLRGGDAAALKHADLVALATEKRGCMAPSPRPWPGLPEPYHFEFDAMSPTTAVGLWLARLRDAGVSGKSNSTEMCAECHDCRTGYGSPQFPDLVVANDVWAKISPTGDEGGLLCPSCMCRRASALGLSNIPAEFRSGPFAKHKEA